MRLGSFSLIYLCILFVVQAASTGAQAEAIISGSIQAKDDCAQAPMEAWLSADSTLLYQVEVPQHGTFEFHVNSGKYDLVVVGATGCLAEAEIEARENDTRKVTLIPTQALNPRKEEKHSSLDWLIPSAHAGLSDCPHCGVSVSNGFPLSSPSSPSPWWLMYGSTSYSDFGRPGAWKQNGMNGSMYPGEGELFALRPVLYVNGPSDTPVKIAAQLTEGTHWLVAIPERGAKSWSGRLAQDKFDSGDATYRFIFYDYRADQKKFQDSRGFCAGRDELLPRLSETLKASGFKKNEIEDFSNYWRYKIPPSERYCVYPQSRSELEPSIHLEIEPKPALLTQLLLIVQVGENLDGKGKFHRAPVASWNFDDQQVAARHREPASKSSSGIEVREWGMGFLEGMAGKQSIHE